MRVIVLLLLLAASPGAAQDTKAGRYAFVPIEAGALRLDTATGDVSMCQVQAGATVCAAVPGRSGAGSDAERLAERIEILEMRLARLEAARSSTAALPDEEAMNQVMALAERMMRRFFALVGDLKRDSDKL